MTPSSNEPSSSPAKKEARGIHYHLSLQVVVPMIFSGLAALASVTAFRIVEHYYKLGLPPAWPVFYWSMAVAGFAFLIGLVIVRILLRPTHEFMEKAKHIAVLTGSGLMETRTGNQDRLEHFHKVFEQVSTVLSKVDTRQLFPEIIGESQVMRGLLGQVVKVAPQDATVLILGESGTGKELVATAIHEHSRRREGPLVKLNCAAIPEGLLESELFGHEKGAFTGAAATKKGKFELADGGTLFLDEIGDMPRNTQAKILRALQNREFERVGGTRTIRVDVRIIAATNKNLEKMTERGEFREDLYYRLKVMTLVLPPLKDRAEDLPLLVNHFLQKTNPDKGMSVSAQALRLLMAYDWPGNVRELKNIVERASVLAEEDVIHETHLPSELMREIALPRNPAIGEEGPFSLDEYLQNVELTLIMEALKRTKGVQIRAAEMLGINQRSLWHRIKKHNIDVRLYKPSTD